MRIYRAAGFLATFVGIAGVAVFFEPRGSVRAAEVSVAQRDSDGVFRDKVVPFLAKNCYECHGNGNRKGNLALDSFKSAADVVVHRDQWESVLIDLRGGVMPRSDAKIYPSFSERNAIADWVQNELSAYSAAHPDPGPAARHRLSRKEYVNTIRDLVGVEFKPEKDFPADEAVKWSGLASVNGLLTPEMKAKYVDAAGRIMDEAIAGNSDESKAASAMPAALAADFNDQPTALNRSAAAREILGRFARRAWRRPITVGELDGLMDLFTAADKNGESFNAAMKSSMKMALVSPDFLFRGESEAEAGGPKPGQLVNEYDLAARLSYFLWSSMPDDELFNLAEHNQLRGELAAQVKRMIASPKAEALVENFTGQWLQFLDMAKPDKKVFPEFDAELRGSMRQETQLFFSAVMREDRSVLDFLNGDYTFVNQRLAELYGIQGVQGEEFRRVSLEGTPRRGVLTQAGVLTSNMYGPRVGIAKRGNWVMVNFLNLPGSTPRIPAPNLPEVGHPGSGPLRRQLEQHRTDQACEYCHVQIDPLGFSMEHFDAIGKWRDKEGEVPVDASGQMPTGESINGSVEMINILAEQHRDQFLECMATKMLAYSLGRRVRVTDQPTVDQIVARMRKNELKFSSLVLGIVNSMPFQMQRGETGSAAN